MKIDNLEQILTTDETVVDPQTLLNRRVGDVALPLLTAAMMRQGQRREPRPASPTAAMTILEDADCGNDNFI